MRNQDVFLADLESTLTDAQRDLKNIQNRVSHALAMVERLKRHTYPKKQDKPLDRQGKDPRREEILNLLGIGIRISAVATKFNTSQRSIRRVIDRAKAEGDERVARWAKELVPADSSQDESRSLREHASDPLAGTNGKPEPAAVPMQQQGGQSEEESTGSRTVEVQARNEPGSTEASRESVPAGRAAETGGEGDASPPEPNTFRSLGDIANDIIARRREQLNKELKAAEDELLAAAEEQGLPDLDDDSLDDFEFSPPVETTLQAAVEEAFAPPPVDTPVFVGIDLSSGPDETIHAMYVRGEGFKPVEFKPLAEAKVRRHIPGPVGIEVDLEANVVRGEAGEQRVDKLFARVLQHMRDGGLYPADVLAKNAGYPKADLVKDSLKAWKPKLEQIGIDVVSLTKGFDLVQLRRLEA